MQPSLRNSSAKLPSKGCSLSTVHGSNGSRQSARAIKRTADLTIATALLALLSPLLLLCGGLVGFTLGRPILFRQERLGLYGQTFTLLKFRTMVSIYDPNGNVLQDHERLTRVGVLLRQFSLDELPQLLNVLRGEMSLVGPRPLLPEYWDLYTPRQKRRNDILPGITGFAQVFGRNSLRWEEKFEMDVQYVENWSVLGDMKILALTALRVISPAGVSAPGHATMSRFRGNDAPSPEEPQ